MLTPLEPQPRPIEPGVRIGHGHLKVSDIERSLASYCGVLGFSLTQRYGADRPEAEWRATRRGGSAWSPSASTWPTCWPLTNERVKP